MFFLNFFSVSPRAFRFPFFLTEWKSGSVWKENLTGRSFESLFSFQLSLLFRFNHRHCPSPPRPPFSLRSFPPPLFVRFFFFLILFPQVLISLIFFFLFSLDYLKSKQWDSQINYLRIVFIDKNLSVCNSEENPPPHMRWSIQRSSSKTTKKKWLRTRLMELIQTPVCSNVHCARQQKKAIINLAAILHF